MTISYAGIENYLEMGLVFNRLLTGLYNNLFPLFIACFVADVRFTSSTGSNACWDLNEDLLVDGWILSFVGRLPFMNSIAQYSVVSHTLNLSSGRLWPQRKSSSWIRAAKPRTGYEMETELFGNSDIGSYNS